jgi:serine/threonine protein phosphatase PrpC
MSIYRFLAKPPRGMNLRAALTLLSGILIALLLLPASAFASSASSGFTFGTSQALDQASVSVVRLTVTYNVIPPISGCASSATGLGVLVGSWNTTPNTADFTNWILSDGSLVNANGIACGIGGKAKAQLSSIQIYANTAFTSATSNPLILKSLNCQAGTCTDGKFAEALKCQNGSDCASGVVLIAFHTSVPLPAIQIAQADQSAPEPSGIALTGTSLPSVAQATAVLTPSLASLSDPKNELGMPIVDSTGQLLDMNLRQQSDPAGTIRSYVTTTLQPMQSNDVQSNWNTGVKAYYAKNYPAAQQAFQNAERPNPQFKAPAAFLTLPAFISSSTSDKTKTPTAGPARQPTLTAQSQSENSINVFGLQLPGSSLIWYILAGILLLVILLIALSLILVRKQNKHREELARFEEEAQRGNAKATADAQRMAKQEIQSQNSVPARSTVALNNQPHAQQAKLACPNCGTAIQAGDNFCPNCRMPLSLSDSGLNVRLAKPVAAPQEAFPAAAGGQVPSSAIYEQPTIEMSPSSQRNGQIEAEKTVPFKTPPMPAPTLAERYIGHKLSLVVGTRSNPGIKRQHRPNEDSLFAAQGERTLNSNPDQFGLFVVADGMGGHANGQDASRLAIQTIVDRLMPKLSSSEHFTDEAYMQMLVEGVQEANQAVHQRNLEHKADMGTTMTATLIVGTTAFVTNVGDSRTYLYREPEGLKKVTNDHSVVASLVEAGIIKPDDIYTHPKRNQIYRSLGEKPVIDVDSFKVPLQPGDKLLLCSDGLWDMVRDPIIQNVLRSVPDPSQTGNALIKAALDGGGEDNVSVIVISVTEATKKTGMTGIQLLAKPDAPQYPPIQ